MGIKIQKCYPSADSYLSNQSSGTNYGSSTLLYQFNNGGSSDRRSIMKFDLTGLSATSNYTSIKLYTYWQTGSAWTTDFYRVKKDWTEGGVTWSSPWASGGCNNTTDSPDRDSTYMGRMNNPGNNTWSSCDLNISYFVEWLNGTRANYGIVGIWSTSTNNDGNIHSRENTNPPYIEAQWTAAGNVMFFFKKLEEEWYKRRKKYERLVKLGGIPVGGQI